LRDGDTLIVTKPDMQLPLRLAATPQNPKGDGVYRDWVMEAQKTIFLFF